MLQNLGGKDMREKIWTMVGGLGIIMLFVGAASMDSERILIQVIMIAAGLALCVLSARVLETEKK